MAIPSYCFGSLQQVLELVKVRIRIGIINQLIQKIKSLPYRHFFFIELQIIPSLLLYKIIRLVGMIQAVKLFYCIARGLFVIAIFLCLLCSGDGIGLRVTLEYIVFPFVETFKRIYFFRGKFPFIIHCKQLRLSFISILNLKIFKVVFAYSLSFIYETVFVNCNQNKPTSKRP